MLSQLSPALKILTFVGGAIGIYKGIEYATGTRVFISFAIEDKNIRTLLAGQAKSEKSPFEFIDMSVKKPWDNAWKTQCRERIKRCHGMIVLVSKNTFNAEGVLWEINCAQQEGIPVMAMYAGSKNKGCRPPKILRGVHIHNWSWKNVTKFITNLG